MIKESKILVVDDEIGVCKSCIKTLSRVGYQVDYSLNGEEALKKIALGKYDLVITDLKMPKVDGMQLLRTVKSRWPEVNVIMITGYGTIRSAVEAIKLGAFDYIPKPFTFEELVGVSERALGFSRIHLEEKQPDVYICSIFSELQKDDLEEMWCIPEHSWAMRTEDRAVKIGLDAMYRRLIGGEIESLELAQVGREIKQGEACARIIVRQPKEQLARKTVCHNLWCPVGGKVLEVNQEVQRDLSLLTTDSYGRGWLICLEPSNLEEDLKNLKRFTDSIGGRVALKHIRH